MGEMRWWDCQGVGCMLGGTSLWSKVVWAVEVVWAEYWVGLDVEEEVCAAWGWDGMRCIASALSADDFCEIDMHTTPWLTW